MKLHTIAQNDQSTVVAEYVSSPRVDHSYQSEKALEKEFITLLQNQGYEYVQLDSQGLEENLKKQIQKLNNIQFTPQEWGNFYSQFIAKGIEGIKEKTKKIQIDHIFPFKLESGERKNIKIIDKDNIHNNFLQVMNQYQNKGTYQNQYDVTILVNGLPLVHIELKRRGVAIKEAFNQIKRYNKDSFWANGGLFEYVQIFVISNGVHTKYYSNTTRETLNQSKKANSFEFTSYWADSQNKAIEDLIDFTKTFFARHTILNILTRYCVFTSDEDLLVMRPYQIVATERILEKIKIIHNEKSYGKPAQGGYIWHTTGSGKTLTSFKTATLAKDLNYIHKVLFVVDRKDLDYQTMKEYDKFEKDSANSNVSTKILQKQLEDSNSKIIITTIQKLDQFIKSNKGHKIFNEEIVMIFDECHRSQLGSMHQSITEAFKKYYFFGFTGTPIFAENCDKNNPLGTTEQKFGKALHKYTIIDAIADKNVLPFRVSYHNTLKAKEGIKNKDVKAINTEKALLDDDRIQKIVKYILENFAHNTKHSESYTFSKLENIQEIARNPKKLEKKKSANLRGFNSVLACSGIEAVKKYYKAFQAMDHNLKIATIFSFCANEDFDGLEDENNEEVGNLDKTSRDFLESAIGDYNKMFGTTYDTTDAKFQNYYKDLSLRVKNREVDILIVANMFLTGFDATTLNTLWVDKNLKYHGLLQAFSRTNRILNSIKTFGNIVCFRDLEKDLNDTLALFGNKDAGGIILLRKYEDYYNGYIDDQGKEYEGYESMIQRLMDCFPLGERILSETKQKEFIKLFGEILKIRNILGCFDEFRDDCLISDRDLQDYQGIYLDLYGERRDGAKGDKEEINDDLEFEIELIKQIEVNIDYILALLEKYATSQDLEKQGIRKEIESSIDSSLAMRNKKDLIMEFIERINHQDQDISRDFERYIEQKCQEEFEEIIRSNRLQENEAYSFVQRAFEKGNIDFKGTEFPKLLPEGTSFFSKTSKREETKRKIEKALQEFFDRFYSISGSMFEEDER